MSTTYLSQDQVKLFRKDGYVIVKDFCNNREVDRLYQTASQENSTQHGSDGLNNQDEKEQTPSVRHDQGNDVFGYLSRSEKIITSVAQLLEGDSPVCHVKSNLVQKAPNVGGVWQWHQDYCYWYKNHFMFPDQLVNVMIALTDINKENGCSQLIKGSHKLGRINHKFEGQQVGADREVVTNSLKKMDLIYAELSAGDAIFFHSNLLHRSDANLSEQSFWSVISCYSSKSNIPSGESLMAWHSPVKVVPNSAITDWENQTAPPAQSCFDGNNNEWQKYAGKHVAVLS